MISRVIVVAAIALTAVPSFGQQTTKTVTESRGIATQELEEILRDAVKLDDKMDLLTVRARAAMLVSFADPLRAEKMFVAAWKFANEQSDESFDPEKAKLVVLKYLYARNPKLARQLLAQQPTKESSPQTRAMGRDNDQQFSSKLASQLVEADPSIAAALLEKSLSIAVTPAGVGTLAQLRQVDYLLADYIAAKVLDGLTVQPTLVSLPAFPLLTAYVFPSPVTTIPSTEATSSLQTVQFRYFLAGNEVLRSSLLETTEGLVKNEGYTPPDLQFRAANQGLLAAILAALAPRFQPSLAPELAQIAGKLSAQVPPEIAQMSHLAVTRLAGNELTSDIPEERFAFALSNGDLDEARKQLDRLPDSKQKDAYAQLLIRNDARARLADADVMGAVIMIRKLEDPTSRLVMYLDALKVAKKKRDAELTKIVVNEARLLIPQTERNGIHIRALFTFASQLTTTEAHADALEFLASAVTSINGLTKRSKEEAEPQTMAEAAMAELNDPAKLLDATEMEQAFSAIGLIDLERALAEAQRINRRSVQLVARLGAIQGIIKSKSMKSKTPPNPPRVSSTPK